MIIALRIDPPKLIPWLSSDERKSNVMLLDFDADMVDKQIARIDLNVVFKPIPVRRGVFQRYDYWVGSTGAQITVDANNGTITECTEEVILNVEYSNTRNTQRKVGLILSPKVKVKKGAEQVDAKIGTITREANRETSFTAKFESEERYLARTLMVDTVTWTITMPRGEKAICDFINGNLYLFTECAWGDSPKSGVVTMRPSDIRFFDREKRPIHSAQSLLMFLIIWHQYGCIENRDGFQIKFEEESL